MYVITHKHFEYHNLPNGYVPLLVGANKNKNPDQFISDNTGKNISDKNPNYCELTGLYWIWKNTSDQNVGISHYRRYFSKFSGKNYFYLNMLLKGKMDIVDSRTLDGYLDNGFDWVVSLPQSGGPGSLWQQYSYNHNIKDIELLRAVINKVSPEYITSFDKVMKENTMASFYNMFYTSRKEFNAYAEWLFKILFEVEKRVDITSYDNYQKRLFGFLGERLMNIWLNHHSKRLKYLLEYNTDQVSRTYAMSRLINKSRFVKLS